MDEAIHGFLQNDIVLDMVDVVVLVVVAGVVAVAFVDTKLL